MQGWVFNDPFWNETLVEAFLSKIPIVIFKLRSLKKLTNKSLKTIKGSTFNFRSLFGNNATFRSIFFLLWALFCLEYASQFRRRKRSFVYFFSFETIFLKIIF